MSSHDDFTWPQDETLAASPGLTPSQTVGPFFHDALPYAAGPQIAGPERPGAVRLHGRILDGAGDPIPDALVEVWQADETGSFPEKPGIFEEVTGADFRGFGRCATDQDGGYAFRTVLPGAVPTVDGEPQQPHLAVSVFARGMLRRLVTRVYLPEVDARADPLLRSLPADRAATMVAARSEDGYRFDVHMQGEQETVFLDVFAR